MRGVLFLAIFASTLQLHAGVGPAKTPEQLAANIMQSAKERNADTFTAQLTTASATALRSAIAAQAALDKAEAAFREALDEKFGKGTEMLTDSSSLVQWITRLSSLEVGKTKAGTAELKVMSADQRGTATLVARQEQGVWKLDLRVDGNSNLTAELQAEARIAKDLAAGKYSDRLSAMLALRSAWNPEERVTGK